jgi:hypothetical protein
MEKGKRKRTEDRMLLPTPDTQLSTGIENLREKLAAALARNNEFDRRAEEDMRENATLAAEKLGNQDEHAKTTNE